MRAWVALLLLAPLLAPTAHADAPGSLVVSLREGASVALPPGAVPLAVIHGFALLQPTGTDAERWESDPRVLRVDVGEPLALQTEAALADAPDNSLRLTRASPSFLAPFAADGHGVAVAVVDSGIDATHPDLAGRILGEWRLLDGAFVPSRVDTDGHGTHVAGIVAGDGTSSQGTHVGTAPGASLVGLDILSQSFTTTSALLAYDWLHENHAQYGIRVVVNAWGRVGDPRTFDPSDPLIRAIDKLVDDGVVVVFSASNHGPAAGSLSVEAQDPRVVTVGAVDDAALLLPYSSRGPVSATLPVTWTKPDLVAPGEDIVSLRSQETPYAPASDPDPLHRVMSGTSQAAPHVAGIIARMIEARPSLTPREVMDDLHASAIAMGSPSADAGYGFGLLDAPDALRAALGHPLARDNPLAAGGDVRYDDAAQVAPTNAGFLGLVPSQEDVWATRFPVPPGTTGIAFELDAPPQTRGLEATLEGPGDAQGPWTDAARQGNQMVLAGHAENLTPGIWTLHVRAALPVTTQLESHVNVLLGRNATRIALYDPSFHVPPTPQARTLLATAVLAADGWGWISPLLVGVVVTPFLWLAWRGRRE